MELRDYQRDVFARARAAYAQGFRAPLAVMPTGAGKTVLGEAVCSGVVGKGGRALWLAHRRELIDQAADRMTCPTGRIMSGRLVDPQAPIQVASIQTLKARGDRPHADFVIIDEGHHAVAETIRDILGYYPNARIMGLTATPQRGDGTSLGGVFDTIIEGPSVRDLMDRGHLVECDVVGPNTSGKELAMDPLDAWQKYSDGRPGFVFCRSVAQSTEIAERFNAAGILTAHVDGKTPKGARDATIKRFRAGLIDVLTSVGVFTEGTDLPRAAVCMLARGCAHVGLYLQMVGRVLRLSPGKERAILIDLLGVVHKHGLPDDPRQWSLEGKGIKEDKEKLPALAQCLKCGGVWRSSGRRDCPRCGWELPGLPPVRVAEREMTNLVERYRPVVAGVQRGASPEQRARKLAELRAHAVAKGYKRGWVAHRYRHLYGVSP